MSEIDVPKLGRMHHLVTRLTDELHVGDLDDASCERLQVVLYQVLVEVGSALPDDLLRELDKVAAPVTCDHPSTCELRVLGAQIMGWIGGIAAAETLERARRAPVRDTAT